MAKRILVVLVAVMLLAGMAYAVTPFGQPKLDVSGMEKREEVVSNGVKESLVYYDKAGKEYVLYSNSITTAQLTDAKKRLEDNLAVLSDPAKTKTSVDAINAQLADVDAKLTLGKNPAPLKQG